jgi:flagellin-like protein
MISNMPKMQKRKAVAPIIATLLLVAIAVVGGIIVFVWASGMFGSTAGTALPTAESIQLIGYDARDTTNLSGIALIDNTASNSLTADGTSSSEYIVLKVRNTGTASMLIDEVSIMGVSHVWDTATDNEVPETGEFMLYDGITGDQTADKGSTSIAAGEDARIVVHLGDLPADSVSIGRNLQFKVKTEQGSSFNFFLVTGQSE